MRTHESMTYTTVSFIPGIDVKAGEAADMRMLRPGVIAVCLERKVLVYQAIDTGDFHLVGEVTLT